MRTIPVAWLSSGAVVGLVGLLHHPMARPLLAHVGWAPGCPVDLDGADPEAAERFRAEQLLRHDGQAPPRSHAALGFVLGSSKRPEVERALARDAAHCTDARRGAALSCKKGGADMHLQFDGKARLVAVDVWHPAETSAAALERLEAVEQHAAATVGPVTARSGVRAAENLAGPLRRVASEFRYAGFVAKLSATNLGRRGIRVREQYQFATPGS